MSQFPDCVHLRFYASNWETITVVQSPRPRGGARAELGPSASGPRGGRRARGEDLRAHGSPRSGLAPTFLCSEEPSRAEPNRTEGRDSVPTWTFSGDVLRGKARTKKDTQAGWTTSESRGEKSWRICSEVVAPFLLQKLSVSKKNRDAVRRKEGKSGAESR